MMGVPCLKAGQAFRGSAVYRGSIPAEQRPSVAAPTILNAKKHLDENYADFLNRHVSQPEESLFIHL